MVGLLGPNGSGKTTLLRVASGLLKPQRGEVWLNGSPLRKLKRKRIAQEVAVVPQQFHVPFAFTVGEVVLLGRIPFIGAFSEEKEWDRQVARWALEAVGIQDLEGRIFNELSGGEQQKAILALALAQEPRLLLLDEPTVHLDISHQVEILELVRDLHRERGITVVAAMHDLNLAALYFDRLVLLEEGRIYADGSPAQVLTEETIDRVFSTQVRVEPHPTTGLPHIVVLPRHHRPSSG